MKKLLFVLALGAFVAACNNGSNDATNADTTTTTTTDTTSTMAPMDTTNHMMDTTHADTSKM